MPTLRPFVTLEGNEAAASVAYKCSEVIAIYPITPSSGMSELSDQWSSAGVKNLWGTVPIVQEMQSEGGAAGAVHGALQTGSLATTFTSSQGLLLMIPNMHKIAGELTSAVFHVAARALAAQGLSIFGDHSDVMQTRSAGWGMLFGNSGQEVMDFAAISFASTLEARVPFLHVFDGFRTSSEVTKLRPLADDDLRGLIDDRLVRAHRERALNPERPVMRGTAQNPDMYFQGRESSNAYYLATPTIVQGVMDRFAALTGRQYHLFDYEGAPDADRVIIIMGSGAETVEETCRYLNARGDKVGVLKVRLFRPFSVEHLIKALPASVRGIAVLDRCKESGSAGEPLYQDIATAISEARFSDHLQAAANLRVLIGGRYGLASKEFTPGMAKAVFDELRKPQPRNHFTVGIHDDVTFTSLPFDADFDIEPADTVRAMFWGLGADGTVGANKNSIKIIGEETDNFAQGYFVYDSKKSGARTVSHLRFGPSPIRAPYLIHRANFIGAHQFGFFERYNVLDSAAEGAVVLINSPYDATTVFGRLPRRAQQQILDRHLKLYVIDAYKVAEDAGMGNRINTVMQVCFFAISGVLPRDEAIARIKDAIRKTYSKRGESVVQKNFAAVDQTLEHLVAVEIPRGAKADGAALPPVVPTDAPVFVQNVTARMISGDGDLLPVSAIPVDGTYPTGTSQWERRNIAQDVPVWDPNLCIQCGKCVLVCPHAVIRAKVYEPADLQGAPETFKSTDARWKELPGQRYTLQVAVEDCTGCALCVEACPVKDKSQVGRRAINMAEQRPLREAEAANWEFFKTLPEIRRDDGLNFGNVKNAQLLQPLFEFSGACAGCGETPYLRLISALVGDRMIVANATGCSSIYGGNLPTTPWAQNKAGRGPAWSNSLFEDNAEFGMGMRLTLDKQAEMAREMLGRLRDAIGSEAAEALLNADQHEDRGVTAQRERVAALKAKLDSLVAAGGDLGALASGLLPIADALVRKSVWIVGGDGWAYDIGYGGLDHVLASGRNVKVLVMDTEVYSNTGGQASKATPLGAVAKFAASGKTMRKKDLGMLAMAYGHVYVAQIAMGASDAQTLKAITEAEAYDGPALIIAYSHCIAHGIDMVQGLKQQKLAVESTYWPLYRFDPRLRQQGRNPLQLDGGPAKVSFRDYADNEQRYRMLAQSHPEHAEQLMSQAQAAVTEHWKRYEELAKT